MSTAWETSQKIDAVTVTVVNNYLQTTVREMGIAMRNTAYSPLFNEGLDFSCAIFDEKADIIAEAGGIPAQVGAIALTVRWTVQEVGFENFNDGDVILHNDPYRGGCHLPEFCVISPVFHRSELVAFRGCIGHMIEIGGKVPAGFPGDASEVFQEGLRMPPVKIVEQGRDREDLWNIILANVRTPRYTYGDLKAMIGSLSVGRKRLVGLIEKRGLAFFRATTETLKTYSETAMREEIRKIPEGTYRYQGVFADNDGLTDKPFNIKVTVAVKDGGIIVDYDGSDKQGVGPINCTYGVTLSSTQIAMLNLTSQEIPGNVGRSRPIKILAPPGTVVNVEYPAPSVGGNSEESEHIVDAIFQALQPALPETIPAECGGTSGIVTFGGLHPDTGEAYTMLNSEPCGWGGRPYADGNSCVNHYNGNCNIIPVEVLESRYPIMHEELSLYADSGGPGKYRGGLGLVRGYKVRAPEIRLSSFIERETVAPRGCAGGRPGARAAVLVKTHDDTKFRNFKEKFGVVCNGKFSDVTLKNGDSVKIIMSGGGGWGDPLDRELTAIARDVDLGLVSKKAAEEEYGVVFGRSKGKLQVDMRRTLALRRRLRRKRARNKR